MQGKFLKILIPLLHITVILFGQCKDAAEILNKTSDTVSYCNWINLKAKTYPGANFAWKKQNQVISDFNSISIHHWDAKPTTYTLEVVDEDGCLSKDSITLISELTMSSLEDVLFLCPPGVQLNQKISSIHSDARIEWKAISDGILSDSSLAPFYSFSTSEINSGLVIFTYRATSSNCIIDYDTVFFIIEPCPNSKMISGFVFDDINKNGIMDENESGIPNVKLFVGNNVVFTNRDGRYWYYVADGSYRIKIVLPFYYSNTTETESDVVIGNSINKNFGIYNTLHEDVQLSLLAMRARPGIPYLIYASITNTGPEVKKIRAEVLVDDERIELVDASHSGRYDINLKLTVWESILLQPGDTIRLYSSYDIPQAVPMGQILRNYIRIYSETNNNTLIAADSVNSVLVNSYDPNDKLVDAYPKIREYIFGSSLLDYTIRFQNTGSDTAYTVVLKDSIDFNLDLQTLKVVNASHNYFLSLNKRVLTVIFANINLVDSLTNEPLSHGYFRFTIRAKSGIGEGEMIRNRAGIYFDYNEPIFTNTTESIIYSTITGFSDKSVIHNYKVFPNPTQDLLYISASKNLQEGVLMDLNGIEVRKLSQIGIISTADLSKGLYILRIKLDDNYFFEKVIVK
ncbi:MAG: SdrD B-like domain-containing protein [Cytophagaceae bacterium]